MPRRWRAGRRPEHCRPSAAAPRARSFSAPAGRASRRARAGMEATTPAGDPKGRSQPADRQRVGEPQQPARSQHASHLAQSHPLVCPVVEGHRRNDEIKARVAKRQGLGGALHEAGAAIGRQRRLGLTDHSPRPGRPRPARRQGTRRRHGAAADRSRRPRRAPDGPRQLAARRLERRPLHRLKGQALQMRAVVAICPGRTRGW
jgi:hypothetical protein